MMMAAGDIIKSVKIIQMDIKSFISYTVDTFFKMMVLAGDEHIDHPVKRIFTNTLLLIFLMRTVITISVIGLFVFIKYGKYTKELLLLDIHCY